MEDKKYHTFNEILSQPQSWKQAFDDIAAGNQKSFKKLENSYDGIILFGCGSSYNLAQSASVFSRYVSRNIESIALPSSELLINPELYIRDSKKYLLVGFSRSGETTESVDVFKNMKNKENADLFAFTCKENSSFIKEAENNFVCRNASEKSIVMTVSFSSMLFSYCLMLAYAAGRKEIADEFKDLISYTEESLDKIVEFAGNHTGSVDFKSYFVLGSGFDYGLAVEADLKMKEMSQVPSYSYHFHEFSHGPKSLLNNDSLCFVLNPPGKKMPKYEQTIQELAELGTYMLVSSRSSSIEMDIVKLTHFPLSTSFKTDMLASFINIPLFQLMAYFKTLKNKLNPDLPKNLSYTVKI